MKKTDTFSKNTGFLSILLIFVGGGLQGYANNTIDAFGTAFIFLSIGVGIEFITLRRNKFAFRAFLLTYSICIFTGGLSQFYSFSIHNVPQSTNDAITFFRFVSSNTDAIGASNIRYINSPLAIYIWRLVYAFSEWCGFTHGPYIGVMFNALVMGLSASLTVRTALELFGNDAWRLRRTGTLFALCGLFILFGALHLRDCFTTLLNIIVLYSLIRWLTNPKLPNLLLAIVSSLIAAYAMSFLRLKSVPLFGLFFLLAALFWLLSKKFNILRLSLVLLIICMTIVIAPALMNYTESLLNVQEKGLETYAEDASTKHSKSSLGMNLVVNQSLPIRLAIGTGAILISPIPLWNNFNFKLIEYHWIKGYNGLYQIIVMPLLFLSFFLAFKMFKSEPKKSAPLLFLVTYLIMNTIAVIATSMEQRHLAQHLPAAMILAALPDSREKTTQHLLRPIIMWWTSIIIMVHLAWALMKRVL